MINLNERMDRSRELTTSWSPVERATDWATKPGGNVDWVLANCLESLKSAREDYGSVNCPSLNNHNCLPRTWNNNSATTANEWALGGWTLNEAQKAKK